MWEKLYDELWDRLTRYCCRLCRDEARAEDLTQETFLRALQNWKLLSALDPRQRKAWLFQTAHNLYCDQLRRSAREQELLDRLLPAGDGEPPDETAAAALGGVELGALLERLDPDDRALFLLRYEEGYSAAELARLLGQPPSTIRARLFRARNQLKDCLKED